MTAAEELAEAREPLYNKENEDFELDYYNMKYSYVEGSSYIPEVLYKVGNKTEYKNMTLYEDPNFYNIPVNTEHSAVSKRPRE